MLIVCIMPRSEEVHNTAICMQELKLLTYVLTICAFNVNKLRKKGFNMTILIF